MFQHQQPEQSNRPFEWPASAPPHPQNLALASKLCATTFPTNYKLDRFTTTHLPSCKSSKDVVKVSFPVPTAYLRSTTHPHNFIVKLPQIQSAPSSTISSHSNCKAEAPRTKWAAQNGFGPNVLAIDEENGAFAMEYIVGRTLSMTLAFKRLPQVVGLLRGIHSAKAEDWMERYDPFEAVKRDLECLKEKTNERESFSKGDIHLIEAVLRKCETEIRAGNGNPLVPCHNHFQSHNIMLRHTTGRSEELLAIDFEDCDLGDPMWDLACLTVSLELEGIPLALADLYGANVDERRRLRAYVPLAMAQCVSLAGVQAGVGVRDQFELMGRLRGVGARYL